MNYTVFSDHTIGESHKKNGMGCEDYSGHYSDPQGRFAIAVICDGHSDPKCFRSAKGARFGCESMIQVMTSWMEGFLGENYKNPMEKIQEKKKEILQRIRMAFVQTWNYKVFEDLKNHPITKEELAQLDKPAYRNALKYYSEGKLLNNIYGATMLAVVVCEDFHMAMHIGDGVVVKLEEGGFYTIPVEEDDKDEMEGPESMCDSDLLSREKAFRISVYPGRPQALFVTSDGIGDMPLTIQLRERLCTFQREMIKRADGEKMPDGLMELNEAQKSFLHSFVEFYSKQGVQDDCCLSGFYDPTVQVSDVRLSEDELQQLYADVAAEYQRREKRYQDTKAKLDANSAEVRNRIEELEKKIANLKKQEAELEAKLGIAKTEQAGYQKVQENNERDFENAGKQYQKAQEMIKTHYGTVKASEGVDTESDLTEKNQEKTDKESISADKNLEAADKENIPAEKNPGNGDMETVNVSAGKDPEPLDKKDKENIPADENSETVNKENVPTDKNSETTDVKSASKHNNGEIKIEYLD